MFYCVLSHNLSNSPFILGYRQKAQKYEDREEIGMVLEAVQLGPRVMAISEKKKK